MRTYPLWMSVVITVLILPVAADAACLIRLESGGRIWTPLCWEEGGEMKFYVGDGIVGVEKNMVRHIEKTAMASGAGPCRYRGEGRNKTLVSGQR